MQRTKQNIVVQSKEKNLPSLHVVRVLNAESQYNTCTAAVYKRVMVRKNNLFEHIFFCRWFVAIPQPKVNTILLFFILFDFFPPVVRQKFSRN